MTPGPEPRLRVIWTDPVTGRKGYAVIDRMVNGLAGGGTRMRSGVSLEEVERLLTQGRAAGLPSVREGKVITIFYAPSEAGSVERALAALRQSLMANPHVRMATSTFTAPT